MTVPRDKVLAILRIVTALLFVEHGMMKLFQFQLPSHSCQTRSRPADRRAA